MEHKLDTYDMVRVPTLVRSKLVSFDTDHPGSNAAEHLEWRKPIWDMAFMRSLEIWKKLPTPNLKASLGASLSEFAIKSLNGKLGLNNGKVCKKTDDNAWIFLAFKPSGKYRLFRPLSPEAIACCKKRAWLMKDIS